MPTEAEIRKRVEKDVGYPVPSPLWQHIFESDTEYRDGDERVIPEITRLVRELVEVLNACNEEGPGMRQPGPTAAGQGMAPQPSGSDQLADYESLRAEAFSQLLADRAANAPIRVDGRQREAGETKVAAFRRRYLGRILNAEDAMSFAESTSNRFTVITPSRPYVIPERWNDPMMPRARFPPNAKTKTIELPTSDGMIGPVTYVDGTALAKLADLADSLSKFYPWSQSDAAWFVLTDEPPFVSPLSIGYQMRGYGLGYSHASITIEVEPWIPAETVNAAYRSLQRQFLGKPANRPKKQAAELVLWVQDRRRKAGRRLTWDELATMRAAEGLPYPHKGNLARAYQYNAETILRFPYRSDVRVFGDDSQTDSQAAEK